MSDSCSEESGQVYPDINRNKCEAKGPCMDVCPYDVFELRTLTAEDKAGQSLIGKIKTWVHGGKQAYAVRAEDCRGCNLCAQACPEKAITLRPVAS